MAGKLHQSRGLHDRRSSEDWRGTSSAEQTAAAPSQTRTAPGCASCLLMFAAFALSPRSGGITPSSPCGRPLEEQLVLTAPPPPASLAAPPRQQQHKQPDPELDAWAASIYRQLAGSPAADLALDPKHPTVPVILHPSAPRGGAAPPVTARHLGFLRVDLTGQSAGPGRFFPLFPADSAEEELGVDTGSLDRFGCSGHWASSGCIRLLTATSGYSSANRAGEDGEAAAEGREGSNNGSQGGAEGGRAAVSTAAAQRARLALMPVPAFTALWERSRHGNTAGSGGGSPDGSGSDPGTSGGARSGSAGDWHVPYARLLPLEEAYGGLARELKAAGLDLSRAHYMLRGWKTKEGRPRLSSTGPRAPPANCAAQRARRGVVPAELAATRELRAMINWPGLLELLEEEEVAAVPTDGVRYWLARLGGGFHARLAAAGVLCSEATVHHIIARSARGIDHPLNYFLVDRGPNSAMGSRVEGFRDASGAKLHMRDVVGERAFEVAQAACNLYHGVLFSGRRRGAALRESLKELREGAFALAEEAIAARQAREARRAARTSGSAPHGMPSTAAAAPCTGSAAVGSPGAAAGAAAAAAAEPEPCQQQQQGSPPRSLKRQRCPGSAWQPTGGGSENEPLNAAPLSPTQQQQERRRRLSEELHRAGPKPMGSPDGLATAAAGDPLSPTAAAAGGEDDEKAKAEMAALSLDCSPSEPAMQDGAREAAQQATPAAEQQLEQEGQGGQAPLEEGMAIADFSSLRARLRAALGVAG